MPLTDDAKKELAEAIRIVREDRFEKFVRAQHVKPKDPNPPKDPLIDPDPEPDPKDPKDPTPPPTKDPEPGPDPEPPVTKRSGYWGELID